MKKLYSLIILLSISLGSFAQLAYQNSFGDTTADFGSAIIKSSQGMYVIVGSTYFYSEDSTEVSIYFVDSLGDLIVSSTVGLPGNDFPTSIVEAVDGNFIVVGYTYASPLDTVNADIFAIKVDNIDGFEVWSQYYGGSEDDKANAIIATPDGNYLIAGSTRSYGPFNQSALAMKIDDNGDLIWTKITGVGIETDYQSAVISLDTNYVLCGTSIDGNGSDHYITKMMSNGAVVWTNQIGSTSNEISSSIALTSDSGYIIAGTYTNPLNDQDQLLTKLDASGNFQWSNTYATVRLDRMYSVLENSQGNYITTGHSNTDTTGSLIFHLTMAELNSTGGVIWANTYGNTAEVSEGYSLITGYDDGYISVGTTYGTGDPNGDVYMVKTDTSGMSGCDELPIPFSELSISMSLISAGFENSITPDILAYSVNSNSFSDQYVSMCFWDGIQYTQSSAKAFLYPNPATDAVTIEGEFDGNTLMIYDRIGQLMYSEKVSGNKTQVNTSDLSQGIYFIRISSGKSNITLKFIKQ